MDLWSYEEGFLILWQTRTTILCPLRQTVKLLHTTPLLGVRTWFAPIIIVFVVELERACAGAIGTTARASAAIKAKLKRMWKKFIFFIDTILL